MKRAPCKFCHLSCSSPISGSERPGWQAKSACQAGWSLFNHPALRYHENSQMLLCKIRESKMQSEQHFSRRQKELCHWKKGHFLCILKTWEGALAPLAPPPPPVPTPLNIDLRSSTTDCNLDRGQESISNYFMSTNIEDNTSRL